MIKLKYLTFILFFCFFFSSCQINQTITMIKDSVRFKSNKDLQSDEISDSKSRKIVEKYKSRNQAIENKKSDTSAKEINEEELRKDNLDADTYALVQPKLKKKEFEIKKRIIAKPFSKTIGLLIPVSGNRGSLGQLVVNSVMLEFERNDIDLLFKVYDTKSKPSGALQALENALADGVKIFIGPIFSDTTKLLRGNNYKRNFTIFSLSNDLDASSEKIIISGINPVDEISCIFQNIKLRGLKKVAVIQRKKNADEKLKLIINKLSKGINLSFLEIGELDDIDKKIKEFSEYSQRKKKLQVQIDHVTNSSLNDEEKTSEIEKLSQMETFGPIPYDAIIINESGSKLLEILSLLAYYDVNAKNSFIIGTRGNDGYRDLNENVFENTFYVSSQAEQKVDYDLKYSSEFFSNPNNINYLTSDLVKLLNLISKKNDGLIENFKFEGVLGLGEITKSNKVKRDFYLMKYTKNKVRKISLCSDSL